jgi:hypothetical protein
MKSSSLGVTSERPMNANILELVSSDITSVGTLWILGNVLSHHVNLILCFTFN